MSMPATGSDSQLPPEQMTALPARVRENSKSAVRLSERARGSRVAGADWFLEQRPTRGAAAEVSGKQLSRNKGEEFSREHRQILPADRG